MCKLTYAQMKELKARADYNHDLFWSLEMYELAYRYTMLGLYIQTKICNLPAVNSFK